MAIMLDNGMIQTTSSRPEQAEGLRLALALAVAMSWSVASIDVSAAFLQALWPTNRPTYGVLPPKILLQAGLVEPEVVFIVKRALYGLCESPALWRLTGQKFSRSLWRTTEMGGSS